ALAHERAVDARGDARHARRLVEAAGLARAGDVLVDHAIAVVVDGVADLGGRADPPVADGHAVHAGGLALLARAVRPVVEAGRRAHRHAVDGGDAVVDDAVAVVVDVVAHLGQRVIAADAEAAAGRAGAGRDGVLRGAGQRADAVGRGGQAAGERRDVVVRD